MSACEVPACLLDFWFKEVLQEMEEAAAKSEPAPQHSQDIEMAYVMVDFLFACQNASTASLTWIFAFLHQHPEALAKVSHPNYSLLYIPFTCLHTTSNRWRDEHDCVRPKRGSDHRGVPTWILTWLLTKGNSLRRPVVHLSVFLWIAEQLAYTDAGIDEILSTRPPAPSVPQMAVADVRLTDDYTVRNSVIIVPSLLAACLQGFPAKKKSSTQIA
jgi:cytochrome P450 family 710 subfamily A protein